MNIPNAKDFELAILNLFKKAEKERREYIDISAGELHRSLGYYPDRKHHRMKTCCYVMRKMMNPNDEILHQPPKGYGASLTIRYRLPR